MQETDIGQIAAHIALVCAVYAAVAAAIGAKLRRPEVVRSAGRAAIATLVAVVVMAGALLYALWTHDFGVSYVVDYSNREEAPIFNFTSLWAGQAGSLMLWCLLLSIFTLVVLRQGRGGRWREFTPWVLAIMMGYQVFFLGLIDFVVDSPWARYNPSAADGAGLQPLLQNTKMLVHPPMLYLGFVALTVPFAFAMAALITGNTGDDWVKATRRWILFGWFFLSCGLLLGGWWAYDELGWGGYWAWDPVENVALLPWLTTTALLHSVLIQERRGMLKVWNMSLVIVTFTLTLFGTFMNRSGIESSVHAFETKGLGLPFVVLIAATLVLSFGLVSRRLAGLGATNRLDAFLSREGMFLLNNLLLAGLAFAVFWGTLFPILSQVVRGQAGAVVVGAPFYNKVTAPLFLILLLAMAVGPLLPWRRAAPENLRKTLPRPLAVGILVGVVCVPLTNDVGAALSFALCAAVLATIVGEFYRGTRAKQRATGLDWGQALVRLVDGAHGRYGGYVIHAGVALIAVGITGSTLLKSDVTSALRVGQSMSVGGYKVTLTRLGEGVVPGTGSIFEGALAVGKGGSSVTTLTPRIINFHQNNVRDAQVIPQVALDTNPLNDVYTTLGVPSNDGKTVRVHVIINPLVWWVWTGGLVLIMGGVLAFSPSAHERRARVPVREPATRVSGVPVR